MVARVTGTVTVNSSNEANQGLYANSTPATDQVYTNMRRSDRVRIIFTNSGISTNKLKITPLISGVFTTNAAQTITGSGNYDFTISSSATLGKQTGPVLKLEAQNSSGTALSGGRQTSYAYLDIHATSSGTVRPYTVTVNPGSKGTPATTTLNWAGSGNDPYPYPNAVVLTEGDVWEISNGSNGVTHSYPDLGDFGAPYATIGTQTFPSFDSVFKAFPQTLSLAAPPEYGQLVPAGTVRAYEVLEMTTDGAAKAMSFAPDSINTSPGSKTFSISGDGTPNTFSDTTTAVTAADTTYTQTFTVSGLATGKKACFFLAGRGSPQIKVGSGSFQDRVVAGNNDTITCQANSAENFDLANVYTIVGVNAAGAHTASTWRIAAPTVGNNVYGMEFYNSSGTKLLSVNDRAGRFVEQDTVEFASHASSTSKTINVTFAAVEDSDEWRISAWIAPNQVAGGAMVSSVTKKDGSFDITTYNYSDSAATYDVTYQIFYSG